MRIWKGLTIWLSVSELTICGCIMVPTIKCEHTSAAAFFCQRCTDIFWDYTHGPYMFVCAIDEDGEMVWEKGLQGTCDGFIEIKVIDNH